MCRGVRGATTVDEDKPEAILRATRELLALMIHINEIRSEDVASVVFTTTKDVVSQYPALAARQLGWLDVPLLCSHEMEVPGSLPRCIRVLLHWNTERSQSDIQHIYLGAAQSLRPDKSVTEEVDMAELQRWIEEQMARWQVKK
ncbi:MAG: chorismate mutase [Caldilineaceae bacterium]|nr:chorismate mutase [Caldilineaceae bacterium]